MSEEPADDGHNALVPTGWRGDEHELAVAAAGEAGLPSEEVELELYTDGFKAGMTLQDPADGAIVVRGRTVLKRKELDKALMPVLRYLDVAGEGVMTRVHDGTFEIRVASRIAEASRASMGTAALALQLWVGFGLVGLAIYQLVPGLRFLSAISWGVGLMLGAWQLRRGLATGRAMLAARLALGLAILAREEKLIPPSGGARRRAAPAAGSWGGVSPEVGLCSICRHARQVDTRRGTVFWRCAVHDRDEAWPKYPPLPVRRCPRFEADDKDGV